MSSVIIFHPPNPTLLFGYKLPLAHAVFGWKGTSVWGLFSPLIIVLNNIYICHFNYCSGLVFVWHPQTIHVWLPCGIQISAWSHVFREIFMTTQSAHITLDISLVYFSTGLCKLPSLCIYFPLSHLSTISMRDGGGSPFVMIFVKSSDWNIRRS